MSYDLLIIRDHAVAVSAASLTLENVIRAFSSALLYEETGDFDVHIRATPAPEARPQVLTVTPLSPGVPEKCDPSVDAFYGVRLGRFQNR
jgi:hypothetical protein